MHRSDNQNDQIKRNKEYHSGFAKTLIGNLYYHLHGLVKKIPDFSTYNGTFIKVPHQITNNEDSCFYVMIYLEHYDADKRAFNYEFPVIS